ncbi:MAG: shikimate kinase [Thermoplasmata archaeon]|nr:shikimate kinase [Thermoplasmata archaeon]
MKGTGRATGAITFVNALATGTGSAAGVTLAVEALVELEPTSGPTSLTVAPDSDSPLVRATFETAIRGWSPGRTWNARLRLRSEVPPARGLKSSSAVSGAVARAVASALHILVTNEEVGRLSADVSQSIGISATGAFDDALATLEPGVHVTGNARRRRLRTDSLDPSWQVVLWIPRQSHLPSPVYRERFHAIPDAGRDAEKAALRGDPLAAMTANTELVEKVVGYDYSGLRSELQRRGALASGVSGLGPALAVVTPPERISGILRGIPPGEGDILVTRFATGPVDFPPGGLA